jgi:hypothetical protein
MFFSSSCKSLKQGTLKFCWRGLSRPANLALLHTDNLLSNFVHIRKLTAYLILRFPSLFNAQKRFAETGSVEGPIFAELSTLL